MMLKRIMPKKEKTLSLLKKIEKEVGLITDELKSELNYINNKPSKEVQHKRNLNYKNLYPEKCKARNKAQYLKKSFKENHLHHWSYNEEHYKDCIELDVKTHHLIHRFIVYDQERMMYRALDGLLLNTKELHLEYINKIILQN